MAETPHETTVTVRIDPDEPDCVDGHNHSWTSPYAVFGGIKKKNPGVLGHGAGVVIREVCRHCGAYRVTIKGDDGRTVEYGDPDGKSLAWVAEADRVRRWRKNMS